MKQCHFEDADRSLFGVNANAISNAVSCHFHQAEMSANITTKKQGNDCVISYTANKYRSTVKSFIVKCATKAERNES